MRAVRTAVRTCVCIALLLMPAAVCAATLPRVSQTLWLNGDGSMRAEVRMTVPRELPTPLRVPVQLGQPAAIDASLQSVTQAATGSNGVQIPLTAAWNAARRQIEVSLPEGRSSDGEVRVTFTLPGVGPGPALQGVHRFSVINTSEHAWAQYSLEVVLPEHYGFAKIDAINASSGPIPRVMAREGRHAVIIETPLREYEGSVSLSATVARVRPARLIPLVALLLSAGYLVRFRDLIARRTP